MGIGWEWTGKLPAKMGIGLGSPGPALDRGSGDLFTRQPGDNPQADRAHHQQHSVHSARIQALL